MDDTADELYLSVETIRALEQFYAEHERKQSDADVTEGLLSISENWQLSQFWYDEATSKLLAEEVWNAAMDGDWIGCLSCPSLYQSLMEATDKHTEEVKRLTVYLFEFDKRFLSLAGDNFIPYDFNHPKAIPDSLLCKFQFIAADPPFLSADCFCKTAELCSKLCSTADSKILFCTGEIMEDTAKQALGLNRTNFNPRHKSKLSNTFASFTNYPPVTLNEKVQTD